MKVQTPTALIAARRALTLGSALWFATLGFAQQSPAPSRAAPGSATPATPAGAVASTSGASSSSEGDDIVQLSPFQVNSAADRGYLATSTMSGTRLNSKLEDLAASISVVTKQQLLDTAATDINDIFLYESNTEGIYQFTSFTVDRGNISDDISANPQGATRVRGLSAANVATNGFATTLPFDTYNIDSAEISRGPNSSVFGLGNSGGGINVIGSKGNLTREINTFTARVDSYGGYRGSFDVNRPLSKDVAAVRVLGLYEDKGFERQPSADVTRRLQTSLALRPFKHTTLNARFESYRNFNSRPNSSTPRDMTTDWVAAGRPTWDPTTQTVNFRDGRAPIANVTTANEATLLPFAIAATDTGFTGRPSWYIDGGQIQLYTINRLPDTTANATGPQNINGTGRLLQNTNFYTRFSATYPLYLPTGINNRALYDWTEVNMAAPNYSRVKGETSSLDLEQIFVRTERHFLALQASWLYERTQTSSRAFLGYSDGGRMQVFIDINEKLLDGTANPYFLRPYVGGSEPAFRKSRNNNENYRGTLSYELNLSREKNFLHWFGLHRFAGYGEYRNIYGGSLGYKDTMASTEAWMGTVTSRNGASYRAYPRYYVGDSTGANVDYAPSRLSPPTNVTLRYFNGAAGRWIDEPTEFSEYYYANRLNRRLLSTHGGTWQGFFLDNRLVGTIGLRRDFNRTRDGNSALNPTAATNGYYDTTPMYSFGQYDWVGGHGKTKNYGVVVKPFNWLHLAYSQSDSFSPGSLAYDIYGQPLPDPQGETKDYGFALLLFPDQTGRPRLNITAKQYETNDRGRGDSSINTIVQRAIRLDADGNGSGGDPDLESFFTTELTKKNPTWTAAQIATETQKLMGVDPDYIDSHRNKTHGDGSDALSRGKEIEIVYNPTNYWTLKSTITQSRAFNATVSPKLQEYIANRISTWTSAKSPFDNSAYWNGTYRVGNLTPEQWYNQNLIAPTKLAVALQGKARSQVREWRVNATTNFRLAGITQQRWLKNADLGGAFRWEDKASIGFFGAKPDADGIVRELDPNRRIWDKSRYYIDLTAGYRFRFLNDKIRTRLQLNVRNAFEAGRLQAVAVNPDGSPYLYRIIDPRQFILTATFDL
ncbi:MAG: TonB-dependent receptor plug domain-containing protein [Verrucomicrobia bacterium]|nr:TonB-dependent receptor plug domain-containing protein [Verrucomicrobiota bacterium]